MKPDQFQIPIGEHHQPELVPDEQLVSAVEEVFENPEIAMASEVSVEQVNAAYYGNERGETIAPYTFVKEIERDLEEKRRADEVSKEAARKLGARILGSVMSVAAKMQLVYKTQSTHEAKLVNKESAIGGALRPLPQGASSQRFWYHKGDWFYGLQDQKGSMYSRYQFSHHSVDKLVGGLPVSFADGEVENLENMVNEYHVRVSEELYKNHSKQDFDLAA